MESQEHFILQSGFNSIPGRGAQEWPPHPRAYSDLVHRRNNSVTLPPSGVDHPTVEDTHIPDSSLLPQSLPAPPTDVPAPPDDARVLPADIGVTTMPPTAAAAVLALSEEKTAATAHSSKGKGVSLPRPPSPSSKRAQGHPSVAAVVGHSSAVAAVVGHSPAVGGHSPVEALAGGVDAGCSDAGLGGPLQLGSPFLPPIPAPSPTDCRPSDGAAVGSSLTGASCSDVESAGLSPLYPRSGASSQPSVKLRTFRRNLRLASKNKGIIKSSLQRAQDIMCSKLLSFNPSSSAVHSGVAQSLSAAPPVEEPRHLPSLTGNNDALPPSTAAAPSPDALPLSTAEDPTPIGSPTPLNRDPSLPLTSREIQSILLSCGINSSNMGPSCKSVAVTLAGPSGDGPAQEGA